jgi:hypothetical protein
VDLTNYTGATLATYSLPNSVFNGGAANPQQYLKIIASGTLGTGTAALQLAVGTQTILSTSTLTVTGQAFEIEALVYLNPGTSNDTSTAKFFANGFMPQLSNQTFPDQLIPGCNIALTSTGTATVSQTTFQVSLGFS